MSAQTWTRLACVLAWMYGLSAIAAADTVSGRLPLAYLAEPGAHPWTGRLRAVDWQTSLPTDDRQPHRALWEAGASLDARQPASRRVFTSVAPDAEQAERMVPLHWPALDPDMQQLAHADHVAWLRGDNTYPTLRPRDTRLASARGGRVQVVAPPVWQLGQPGHAPFRERHRLRPPVAWMGTVDGLLHGFDAITGEERAAYLPRTLLAQAALMANPQAPLASNPCPRPESVDAVVAGEWRTLLLCGFRAGAEGAAGLFVLDVTDPSGAAPIQLLWELASTPALPLAGSGTVRAAALADGQARHWYAVAPLAPPSPPGLALLTLDKPAAAPWLGQWAPRVLRLADHGCDGKPSTTTLRTVTIASALAGTALAAYATDSAGQLWHFDLRDILRRPASPATCVHRLRSGSQLADTASPLLLGSPDHPLVVYGAANELVAVPGSMPAAGQPVSITAHPQGDGFVLRATAGQGNATPAAGWHLLLPEDGEQVEQLSLVAPGYVTIVTRLPDGRQRNYLVLAASGESIGRGTEGAPVVHYVTGQYAAPGAAIPALTRDALPVHAPEAGMPGREAYALTLWSVDGHAAKRLAQVVASRRTGRLAWRELVGPPKGAAP